MNPRKLGAEFIGTLWLVLGGCGSAVLAAGFVPAPGPGGPGPSINIGLVGVSLAFGLTVLTGAFAFGGISGGHFNPAVTLGLWAAKKFPAKDIVGYIAAQIAGGVAAIGILAAIVAGQTNGGSVGDRMADVSNGYGSHSPGLYKAGSAFVAEMVLTAIFVLVILGSTHGRAPKGFAPISIGLCLTLIHLISIPVTNTSVNPARSLAPAIFGKGWPLGQVWLFIVAPIVGAIVAGLVWSSMFDADDEVVAAA